MRTHVTDVYINENKQILKTWDFQHLISQKSIGDVSPSMDITEVFVKERSGLHLLNMILLLFKIFCELYFYVFFIKATNLN